MEYLKEIYTTLQTLEKKSFLEITQQDKEIIF